MVLKSNKYKYGFVVLHYNNYKDTIACVESILRINHRNDYCIIIIDNASSNNSFELLSSRFEDHPKITLVLSDKNGGYSAGNNIGIRILLDMGIAQIVIATNDTEIISTNLLDEFDKLDLSGVGIVGTDVVTPDGTQQNPPVNIPSLLYFLNLYLYKPMAKLRKGLYIILPILKRHRHSSVAKRLKSLERSSAVLNQCSVYMLHGCFLYLTKNYLDKVGLLDENLFMYGEEDLMSWNCELHGLKRLYLPSAKILHKDGLSTKEVHKEGNEEFVSMMSIKSKQYLCKKITMWKLMKIILCNWVNND